MYFDAKAISRLISEPDTAQKAAPVIDALRKRFTSPLAVVEAVLTLGAGKDKAATEAQVTAFLDATGIEMRDMPPSNKLLAAAVEAEQGDTLAVLNAACAQYYEVEPFSLSDALATAAAPAAVAPAATATKPAATAPVAPAGKSDAGL